jgi:hypothetical protein
MIHLEVLRSHCANRNEVQKTLQDVGFTEDEDLEEDVGYYNRSSAYNITSAEVRQERKKREDMIVYIRGMEKKQVRKERKIYRYKKNKK